MKTVSKMKTFSKMKTSSKMTLKHTPVTISHRIKEVEKVARNTIAPEMEGV